MPQKAVKNEAKCQGLRKKTALSPRPKRTFYLLLLLLSLEQGYLLLGTTVELCGVMACSQHGRHSFCCA